MKIERVVIGIDFGERSIGAAHWVARTVAPGAELVLVHVLEAPQPPSFLAGRHSGHERLLALHRDGTTSRLTALARQLGVERVDTALRGGRPDQELARVARERHADLIVVGSHRDRAGFWSRLGSTAERILCRASVPVLVVHGVPRAAPRTLFAAVDDSPVADVVSDVTQVLAHRFGARGVVTHILPQLLVRRMLTPGSLDVTDVDVMQAEANIVDAARQWLDAKIRRTGIDLVPAVMVGDAAETILLEAGRRGADLIVLGRARRAATRRFFLGSVAGAVIRAARCPVLVVPGDMVPSRRDAVRARPAWREREQREQRERMVV